MKIGLITDTHFGARNNSIKFDNFFRRFYENCFFPELKKRNIKNVIHAGDCFEERKSINYEILDTCRKYFFDTACNQDISLNMIVGNHDSRYKNTIRVNAQTLLLQEFDNITVFDQPTEFENWGLKFLFCPWICEDNIEKTMQVIENTNAKVCIGHFEIDGFSMYKGVESRGGLNPILFRKFEKVFSGHYHTKSKRGNIEYLGNPYEITWNDFDDLRGFHIFDTETLELEFIQNPYTMFEEIEYNDDLKIENLSEKIVRLVVNDEIKDNKKYEKLIKQIESENPEELKIKDNTLYKNEKIDLKSLSSTLKMLNEYIESSDIIDERKKKVKDIMNNLYQEAIDVC